MSGHGQLLQMRAVGVREDADGSAIAERWASSAAVGTLPCRQLPPCTGTLTMARGLLSDLRMKRFENVLVKEARK